VPLLQLPDQRVSSSVSQHFRNRIFIRTVGDMIDGSANRGGRCNCHSNDADWSLTLLRGRRADRDPLQLPARAGSPLAQRGVTCGIIEILTG
jgi:hypothetical protein